MAFTNVAILKTTKLLTGNDHVIDTFTIKPLLKIIADVAHGIIYLMYLNKVALKLRIQTTIEHYMCCGLVPFQIIFFPRKKIVKWLCLVRGTYNHI